MLSYRFNSELQAKQDIDGKAQGTAGGAFPILKLIYLFIFRYINNIDIKYSEKEERDG